ncbi:MAG: hypothetical protein COC00_010270 [Rhizobiales bacterium]|nr:hypothetical protein [Hyphomicrobiales bacterium]
MNPRSPKDAQAVERRKKALRDNLKKRKAVVRTIKSDANSAVLIRKSEIEKKPTVKTS